MTRNDRPEGRPLKGLETREQSTKPATSDRERGSVLRLTDDPDLDAAEMLARLGPLGACAFALALLRLVAEATR